MDELDRYGLTRVEEGGNGPKVLPRLLEDEMRESFIDYSMSVIVQRALPDVRDGLKPVHRRILYAMLEAGLLPNRPYKKSATVVGDVLGKYHPHGDMAVYDSLVRMVQDFSLRYPLVDGQGNFGSVDGDGPAAYRYTEARLAPIALELLEDIDKETVDFVPNFDGRLREPTVLPGKLPNLLVNGSSGIAVGMATNIPPHNLREIVAAALALIRDPELPQEELEELVSGPDFPTGGIIVGREGVRETYRTGRGRIVVRARAEIEEVHGGGERIVVREIPFMVNKARLLEQIAQLVRDKKITEIRDLRDESDREGMRVVVELKRDANPHVVLNRLYKHTQMQTTFGAIFLALVEGVPRILNLRQMLLHFLEHRHTVVRRRSEFELRKAREREHILEGLKVAVDHIDEVIQIIRTSDDPAVAAQRLRERFALSEAQADAILNMRLARLTALEKSKLEEELASLRARIQELEVLLASREHRMEVVAQELEELSRKYGDDRRTDIIPGDGSLDPEDLIADTEVVITISHQGYIKRTDVDTYRAQRRGGRGLQGMDTKEEDWVEHLFVASTHDDLMVFTRGGHCYWLKVWQIPEGGRQSRGRPIVHLLNLRPEEQIAAVVPVREFREDRYVFFATRQGVVKKTPLAAYGNKRGVGVNAIHIREGDELIEVKVTGGEDEIVLATREGVAIRFGETDVRPMGRTASGVRGIELKADDEVVGMVVVSDPRETTLLVVTETGMGKRTALEAYRRQRRGGRGILNVRVTPKTGKVVAIKGVKQDDELMLVTRNGVVNRQKVSEIRCIGRATQGVRLVNLDEGDRLVDVARVVRDNGEGEEEGKEPVGDQGGSFEVPGSLGPGAEGVGTAGHEEV